MFKRIKSKQPTANNNNQDSVDTIIGSGTYLNGKITAKETLRIDGRVDGEIEVEGNIYLGENSVIKANVVCDNMTVAGEVHGMISADGKLHIAPSGKVFGDINVGDLIINDGAVFKGNCKMAGGSEAVKSVLENGGGID